MRDVARCEETRGARLEAFVDDHAVFDPQARRLDEAAARRNPDADDDEVRLDHRAIPREDAFDRPRALKPLHGGLRQELHPVVSVKVEIDPADLRAEHPLEWE